MNIFLVDPTLIAIKCRLFFVKLAIWLLAIPAEAFWKFAGWRARLYLRLSNLEGE